MKTGTLLIGLVLAGLIGLGGWYGWRWYTTPKPPDIPLTGASKEMAEAVEEALQAVRRQPRSGRTWGKLSMVLTANGFNEQAIECLAQAERFDPQEPRWPYARGILLLLNNPREGIPLLRRALSLTSDAETRAAILFRLAVALVGDGHLDEAEEHLQSLRQIEKDGPRLDYGLGLLAVAREDHAAARKHLSKLTEVPYARKKVCSLLARLSDGNEELARTYEKRAAEYPMDADWPNPFEDAIRPYKVDPSSRLAKYRELDEEGRHAEALAVLRQLVAESPDAAACFTLGLAHFKRQQFEEAEAALRASLRFDSQNAKTHYFLGATLLRRGEQRAGEARDRESAQELFRQALAAVDRALSLQSDLGDAHLTRGQALKHLGRTGQCLEALRQALLYQPDSAEMHLALGEALAEAGQVREALEHLENAVRLAPPNAPRPRQVLEKWRSKAKKSTSSNLLTLPRLSS